MEIFNVNAISQDQNLVAIIVRKWTPSKIKSYIDSIVRTAASGLIDMWEHFESF